MKGFILHSFYWKFLKKRKQQQQRRPKLQMCVFSSFLKKKNYSNKLRYIEVKEYNTSSIYGVLI